MRHIDLSAVLRRTVCELYSNLVTRPTGAAVRGEIEQNLDDTPGRVLTVIDFSNVALLDYSCADEIVAKLLLRYTGDAAPHEGYFLFRGVRDHHLDAIEVVLERHGLALVTQESDGTPALIGRVDAIERRVWDAMVREGPGAPADVAGWTGLSATDAREMLEHLSRRRLAMPLDAEPAPQYLAVGCAA